MYYEEGGVAKLFLLWTQYCIIFTFAMACTINFNSDSTGSFYAGDIVTGTVILELKNEQKFQSNSSTT